MSQGCTKAGANKETKSGKVDALAIFRKRPQGDQGGWLRPKVIGSPQTVEAQARQPCTPALSKVLSTSRLIKDNQQFVSTILGLNSRTKLRNTPILIERDPLSVLMANFNKPDKKLYIYIHQIYARPSCGKNIVIVRVHLSTMYIIDSIGHGSFHFL